jgi:hypothetical protein
VRTAVKPFAEAKGGVRMASAAWLATGQAG